MKVYSVLTNFVFIPPKVRIFNSLTTKFEIFLLHFIVRVDNNMFGILFLEHSWHPSDNNIFSDYLKKELPSAAINLLLH